MYTVYWYIWYFPCKYLFELRWQFSCGWLQAKLIKEEFDLYCSGLSKAYNSPNKPTLITNSSFHQVLVLSISCCVWWAVETSNLAPELYIKRETKWPLLYCCHGNTLGSSLFLCKTKYPRLQPFWVGQGVFLETDIVPTLS